MAKYKNGHDCLECSEPLPLSLDDGDEGSILCDDCAEGLLKARNEKALNNYHRRRANQACV